MAQDNPWKWHKQRKRWLYDYKNQRLGIPRSRGAFRTEAEAEYFHREILKKYLGIGDAQKPLVTFGKALADHLQFVSAYHLGHSDNLSNAAALRWPYEYKGNFYRLEELPLSDDSTGIIVGLDRWLEDQRKVTKRAYLQGEVYQLRHGQWFLQPRASDHRRPAQRELVTNSRTLDRLAQLKGRGPFSRDTLRLRQQLVAAVLQSAYLKFRTVNVNLADFITRLEGHEGHKRFLTAGEQECLISCATKHSGEMFALLIEGAMTIGWRRSNLIGLTWDRVHWRTQTQPGFLHIPRTKAASFDHSDKTLRRERTKNRDELVTVMDEAMEQLLERMAQLRHPYSQVVFHDGAGQYFGECRDKWLAVKAAANISADFRWHDLRHTWATDIVNKGIDDQTIMEQQGWKDSKMVRRYGHKDLTTRANALTRKL